MLRCRFLKLASSAGNCCACCAVSPQLLDRQEIALTPDWPYAMWPHPKNCRSSSAAEQEQLCLQATPLSFAASISFESRSASVGACVLMYDGEGLSLCPHRSLESVVVEERGPRTWPSSSWITSAGLMPKAVVASAAQRPGFHSRCAKPQDGVSRCHWTWQTTDGSRSHPCGPSWPPARTRCLPGRGDQAGGRTSCDIGASDGSSDRRQNSIAISDACCSSGPGRLPPANRRVAAIVDRQYPSRCHGSSWTGSPTRRPSGTRKYCFDERQDPLAVGHAGRFQPPSSTSAAGSR